MLPLHTVAHDALVNVLAVEIAAGCVIVTDCVATHPNESVAVTKVERCCHMLAGGG